MKTIEITADDMLFQSLEDLARAESKSLEALAREALSQYVKRLTAKRPSYSFIGIGRSGKGNLSTKVEETLAAGASRRGGWSLSG